MYDVFVWPFRLPLSLSVSLTMATFFGGLSVFQRLDPHSGLSPASFKLQWDCGEMTWTGLRPAFIGWHCLKTAP